MRQQHRDDAESSKKMIVNADDFGMTQGINEAIIACFRNGTVTRASLLANGSCFEDAVVKAAQNPGLKIGVHLNIFRFKPLLPSAQLTSLCNNEGTLMNSLGEIMPRAVLGRISLAEVRAEWQAQIQRVLTAGITPSHIDSDKHLHLWPPFFKIACELAVQFKIKTLRLVFEPMGGSLKANILTGLSLYNRFLHSRAGLIGADHTLGIARAAATIGTFDRMLASAAPGITELITHPGYLTSELMGPQNDLNARWTGGREAELKTLLDVSAQALIKNHNIKLISALDA